MKRFEVPGHESSLLPDGEWKLTWCDEFDGDTLDAAKWDYRLSMMGQTCRQWTDKAVYLDGKSNAVFKIVMEDGIPKSSQLQTGYNFMDEPVVKTTFGNDHLQWPIGKLHENKFTHRYGYYECRCRLQQKEGWWSAFWIQSPMIGASLDPTFSGTEIDIMESFHPGKIAKHNAYTGGYGLDMKREKVGGKMIENIEQFHRFGLLWDERGYTFYIDGVEDGHIDQYVSHIPQFILISTEVRGYRNAEHAPTEQAIQTAKEGDDFLVDYIRVFDRI